MQISREGGEEALAAERWEKGAEWEEEFAKRTRGRRAGENLGASLAEKTAWRMGRKLEQA